MAIASIQRIAIIGGTHGNELTGVYLVKKFQQHPDLITRPSLHVTTLLANPKAIALNRRYVDRDLNRCFDPADLKNPALNTYEDQRAKAIATQLLPPNEPQIDFILDLHSTTANMGLTVLLSNAHPFNLQLAAYLCQVNPNVKVCFREAEFEPAPMLRSLTPLGCTLEVGPVPQGVLQATSLIETEKLVHRILDYIDAHNRGNSLPTPQTLTTYQSIQTLDYPRNDQGDIEALIHPQRQSQDYQCLNPGDPIFLTFTGASISYSGNYSVFPVFINEAAYYEKHIAMVLTQQKTFDIKT